MAFNGQSFDITDAVTLFDVSDGLTGVSVVMSNELHGFAADASGIVTQAERQGFSSQARVFIGTASAAPYSATGAIPAGSFRISATSSDVAWIIATSSTGVITVTTIPTGTTNVGATISVNITVNNAGTTQEFTRTITLTKNIAGQAGGTGPAGPIGGTVSLAPSRDTFVFDAAGTLVSGQGAITFTAASNAGIDAGAAYQWFISRDGAGFGSAINQVSPPTGITFSGTGNNVLSLSSIGFGTNQYVTIRVVRDGVIDQTTVVRVVNGGDGDDAFYANIVVESGGAGFTFRNNAGTDKVLRVDVYVGGVALTDAQHNSLSVNTGNVYQWQKNGVNLTTTATQGSGQGSTSRRVVIGAGDVNDGGADDFTCNVRCD